MALMDLAAQRRQQGAPGGSTPAEATPVEPPQRDGALPGAGPEDGTGTGGGATYTKPDISQFVPPDDKDTVDRVVAAGMRLMYAPETRDELASQVQRDDPVPQKLAENAVGVLLMLDQQARGGIPAAAIVPATLELLGECAEVLSAAGEQVTQQDYNDAMRVAIVLIGRKLGADDGQIGEALQGRAIEPQAGAAPGGAQAPGGRPSALQQPMQGG